MRRGKKPPPKTQLWTLNRGRIKDTDNNRQSKSSTQYEENQLLSFYMTTIHSLLPQDNIPDKKLAAMHEGCVQNVPTFSVPEGQRKWFLFDKLSSHFLWFKLPTDQIKLKKKTKTVSHMKHWSAQWTDHFTDVNAKECLSGLVEVMLDHDKKAEYNFCYCKPTQISIAASWLPILSPWTGALILQGEIWWDHDAIQWSLSSSSVIMPSRNILTAALPCFVSLWPQI